MQVDPLGFMFLGNLDTFAIWVRSLFFVWLIMENTRGKMHIEKLAQNPPKSDNCLEPKAILSFLGDVGLYKIGLKMSSLVHVGPK